MKPAPESVRNSRHSDDVTRAAQWLADRKVPTTVGDGSANLPVLPTLKARFGLTDADAAEAILLAGSFSVVRRAFG